MPPFKDEHILIIAPGSQTTLAQLGLPESFTPARLRISTRMFPAEKKGEWEPYRVREKKSQRSNGNEVSGGSSEVNTDVNMADGNGPVADGPPKTEDTEDDIIYEEDPASDEGAVYPLREGRVVDWSCFFALLTHVYNTLSPPFHTPILLISQPAWTAQDHEILTQFFFEKFKTPAFCLMDSALAVSYAYGVPTATIVDVGHGKCDISAVSDFMVYDIGRGVAVPGCGGEGMTERLLELLSPIGFNWEMCEQLKKSNICEILPPGTTMPGSPDTEVQISNPAAAASTGAVGSGPGQRGSIAAQGGAPRGPGMDTEVGDEEQDREVKDGEDNEGVLDVASIVASGKTNEFLAKKEREKTEKAAAKKAAADAAAAPKPQRLPNSKREKTTFHYDERRPLEDINENGKRQAETENAQEGSDSKRQKTPEPVNESAPSAADETMTKDADAAKRQQDKAARKEERRRNRDGNSAYVRKEIEVGVERFMAASGGTLEQIADTIHRTILSVPEVAKRSELWDSLVILGNGSKVKGFKEALLLTLQAKYIISPSSATIFTSELPSNLSTPLGTGTNTPQPQSQSQLQHSTSHGVNPLLYAATTASNPTLHPPSQHLQPQNQHLQNYAALHALSGMHSSHGQTPTSIKLAKMPEYFPEWKDVGFDEAAFLGAQVAAKVVFVVDQGLSKGFMTRVEYNELGPQGIHESCL
ncbi:MAG: Actin-like protein arp9 (SWI/SNF complex component arp9) [Pleopsidium flavum]|nr:MAG: Actin-like protein arp9 (SWI/SNF complex component arp9) [Pleopsidium flavum]